MQLDRRGPLAPPALGTAEEPPSLAVEAPPFNEATWNKLAGLRIVDKAWLVHQLTGRVMPEVPPKATLDNKNQHLKTCFGILPEGTSGEPADPPEAELPNPATPSYLWDTPLGVLFDAAGLAEWEKLTIPEMKKKLTAAGVEVKELPSDMRKRDYAVCLMMTGLSKVEARAIHEFIDMRVPPEPFRVALGPKPYVSAWYNKLFNPVDRWNRLIYQLYNDHPVTYWKFRMLLYFGAAAMINLWAWIGNLTFTRQRMLQSLDRDVAELKEFIQEVLGYLKKAWAPELLPE